jgi:hypothetical protein
MDYSSPFLDRRTSVANFSLMAMDRRQIQLPKDRYWPHPDASA